MPCVPFLLALTLLLAGVPPAAPARASCPGDCAGDLATRPRAVELYVKRRWEAVSRCAKRAMPACPEACPVPDAAALPFDLSPACAALVACETDALAALAHEGTWDAMGSCALGPATACGRARGSGGGDLVARRLTRRRTSTLDRLPRDLERCVRRVDRGGSCGGPALCAAAGRWVDAQLPLRLAKNGYQSLPFEAFAGGEGIATLTLAAETAGWGTAGRESVVVEYDLDGVVVGSLVLYGGAQATAYPVLLGDVAAGVHRIGLRHRARSSPAFDSAVTIHAAASAEAIPAADPRHDLTRYAPLLLGIDTKLNPIGTSTTRHPGNAVSDVPLIVYATGVPGAGITTYRYVMIWSNEDGGTGAFPPVLMAQWGRTTDIETILEVDVTDAGALAAVRYRPDESGTLASFAGAFHGTHPILRTRTANGLLADDGASTLVFAIAPRGYDDGGVPRETALDLDPVAYRVMAEEMAREGKTEEVANPATATLSDLRNYLYLDYAIDTDASGRVLRAVAVVNGVPYASDHFVTSFSPVFNPRVADGIGRTAIELPPGTSVADVEQLGLAGIGTMSGTLYALDAFMLGADYLPGPHLGFDGALAAGGVNPSWLVTP